LSFPKIRDITLRILTTCGIEQPPVRLEPILQRFHARVTDSRHIAESALMRDSSGWMIKVNTDIREERREFRIAHELAHIYWSHPDNHQGDPTLGGKLERYCSKFASLLLCPHQWFAADAPEVDYDLAKLKALYANVSYEALAIRISYLTPMVVTIYDNGKLYRRFSSPGLGFPPDGQPVEKELHSQVDIYGKFRESAGTIKWGGINRSVRVRGYPVFSGKFRRIILLTTPSGGSVAHDDPGFEDDMPYPFPEY
jgi:hypothetical protein